MPYLSVKQVASMFKVTEKTVRRFIHRGQLKAKKVSGHWLIKTVPALSAPGRTVVFIGGISKSRPRTRRR
jgi:excisionase family DNA binding protein